MPIFDNHIHLRASFRGVEAAKDFERWGGTSFMLTHSPYEDVRIRSGGDFARAYQKTLAMADAVRKATSLQVFVALGPYPVEFQQLAAAYGIKEAAAATEEGVRLAADHIERGAAVAFGEVGRPHFPVPEEIVRGCNDILRYIFSEAKRLGCATILHSEDPTPETFAEFAALADRMGLGRHRVVKHHSTPLTRTQENHGIVPSILAKDEIVVEALRGTPRFLLETDYIDDPRRPGAVLGPATVPRKTKMWLERGVLSADQASVVHKELPEATYGIRLR